MEKAAKMKIETFDVKWHSFTDHLKIMLHKIRSSGLYTDVTFICDDQKELKAHMNVVGACSPVLRNIFTVLKGDNPTIYLRGIKHAEMESLLEFMYLGEAKILSDRVNDFLTVAKDLEIEELCQRIKGQDLKDVKKESTDEDEEHFEEEYEIEDMDEMDSDQDQTNKPRNERRKPKERKLRKKVVEKNDSSADNLTHKCSDCDKEYSSPSGLYYHRNSAHKNINFNCKLCDFKATRKEYLNSHMSRLHRDFTEDSERMKQARMLLNKLE